MNFSYANEIKSGLIGDVLKMMRIGPSYHFVYKNFPFWLFVMKSTVPDRRTRMKLLVVVLILQISVIAVAIATLSKHRRKEKSAVEGQRQVVTDTTPGKSKFVTLLCYLNIVHNLIFTDLADPYCQSLIANVAGTFQSKNATSPSFAAQFQVRVDANLKTQRITVDANQWNEEYSSSVDFYLDFYYSKSQEW
jgi:hypothetical protein